MKNKKLYFYKLNTKTFNFENYELIIIHEFNSADKKFFMCYKNNKNKTGITVDSELINKFSRYIFDKNEDSDLVFISDKNEDMFIMRCNLLNQMKEFHIKNLNKTNEIIEKISSLIKETISKGVINEK